jgi:hypothetical protein
MDKGENPHILRISRKMGNNIAIWLINASFQALASQCTVCNEWSV